MMYIKAIGKLQVRRAYVQAHLNVAWEELDPLRYGYHMQIDNDSAQYLIRDGHCVQTNAEGVPKKKLKEG